MRMFASEPQRKGISSTNLVVGSVLWICVLVATGLVFVSGRSRKPNPTVPVPMSAAAPALTIRFPARELPDFEFPECMGGTVSRDGLRGHPWVASFVFTRCRETCPMITRAVMELHQRVAETRPDIKFVSFSVDSSFDSADVLREYADIYTADHDRWKFVTGDEQQIHDLIRKGFAMFVKPNLGNERKPGFEVAHSNRVVLVNENAVPVATYLGTNPDDMAKLRQVLEGKDEFPQPVSPDSADPTTAPMMLHPDIRPAPTASEEPPGQAEKVPEPSEAGPSEAAEPNAARRETSFLLQTGQARFTAFVKPDDAETNAMIDQKLPPWARRLPDVNAALNAGCTVLLIAGIRAIRRGKKQLHRNLMVSAFATSVIFLGSYLTYHYILGESTGEHGRRFVGSALALTVYRCILFPHVVLAAFVPFLAIRVLQHAVRARWENHRRLAKISIPIWLFVSVTGVIIYWMLYQWPWSGAEIQAAGAARVAV